MGDALTPAWITEGFQAFRRGTFGNGGHNLYVSRAGVLQRIHQYDLDGDGYIDLVFSNSHDYWETAPSALYRWRDGTFERTDVPAPGGRCAVIADLTGDGVADLVVGRQFDGVGFDVNAVVLYGTEQGWGEHAIQYLPAPDCRAVAAGDFNGDGRQDLAFVLGTGLRVFPQTELAFQPKGFVDLPITGTELAAADLDGDGSAELVVRSGSTVHVYWGGPGGLSAERRTAVPWTATGTESRIAGSFAVQAAEAYAETAGPPAPQLSVLAVGGRPHLFLAGPDEFALLPVGPGRSFGAPLEFAVPGALAVAVADLDGDGFDDLVVATGESGASVWWGGPDGWAASAGVRLPVERACDVAVGDLDGDGRPEIALAAFHDAERFTVPSRVLKLDGREAQPWQTLETHDPRMVRVVESAGQDPGLFVLNRYGRSLADRGEVYVYPGGPDGYSADRLVRVPSWGACVSICADLDDDGRVDLVVVNAAESGGDQAPGSYVYRNAGPGFAPVLASVVPPLNPQGGACADLDRDGYLDLVFGATSEPEITIVPGGPDGFDPARARVIRFDAGHEHAQLRFIQLVDLDGDGWLDLVVPIIDAPFSVVLWGGPDGFSAERCQRLAVWHACSAQAADLDGDGRPELILGGHSASGTGPHDSFAYIYWNGPDGLREDRRTLLPGEAINSIGVADFDNDGLLDVYVGSYQDGRKRRDIDSYIYWNRAGRGFSAADFTRLFTHSASGDFAADLNGDGWVDLVVANHKTYGDHVGDSTIWWNGPDGFDERRVTRLPTRGPHGMVTPGPGNILDRGPEEFYDSEPQPVPDGCVPGRVTWLSDLGPRTWVRAQVRTASSAAGLAAEAWRGSDGPGSWLENGAQIPERAGGAAGGWVQYRLALGATNSGSTPRVTRVTVEFRPLSGV